MRTFAMVRLRLLLLAATTAGSSWTLAQTPLDEEAFVARVLAATPTVRLIEAQLAEERAALAGAGAWPNPSLAWQREDLGPSGGETQDQLSASIALPLSGRPGLLSDAARLEGRAAEARTRSRYAAARARAIEAFTRLRAATARAELLGQSSAALHQVAAAIVVRERSGDASGYDRLRIELEVATVDEEAAAAKVAEQQARAEAALLLDVDAVPALEGPLAPPRALPAEGETRVRGEVEALALSAEAADAQLRAAGRGWIPEPRVSAGAQRVRGEGRSGTGYLVGLEVPLPVFDHRQGDAGRARAARDLARARAEQARAAASRRTATARAAARSLRERLDHHRAAILPRATALRTAAASAYRNGAAELLVLVDAERAAREALLRELALAEQVVAAELEFLLITGALESAPGGSHR